MVKIKDCFQECSRKITVFLIDRRFPFLLIAAGILFRLKHYLENPSLNLDEAALSLEIISRPFNEIFLSIGYNRFAPTAPIGFLLLEKGAIASGSHHEYALRFFPLIFSIASIFLFYRLTRRYLSAPAGAMALALFVLSKPLIYYAASVKHYGLDVFFALLILSAVDCINTKGLNFRRSIMLALIGVVAVWFSYSVIFVLAAAGLTLAVGCLVKRSRRETSFLLWVGCLWILSFTALYANELSQIAGNPMLFKMWNKAFMPLPPSAESLVWLKDSFAGAAQFTLGLPFPWIGLLLAGFGCLSFFQKNKERLFLLISPILIALLAAIAHKYPFFQRFILFTVPLWIILTAEGFALILRRIPRYKFATASILTALLLYYPVANALFYLRHSHDRQQSRPVMEFFKRHYIEGDLIYINDYAVDIFLYYEDALNITPKIKRARLTLNDVVDRNGLKTLFWDQEFVYSREGSYEGVRRGYQLREISQTHHPEFDSGDRVWFLVMHAGPGLEDFLLETFDRHGIRLRELRMAGASAYLFEIAAP